MKNGVNNLGAVLTLYFTYFAYAMGLIVSGQLAGSPDKGWGLSVAWGVETKDVISAISVMAIGKIIVYPFAGWLSDRFGRKNIVLTGIILNAAFFLLLPISPNRTIGMLLALVFGASNSFLDAGTYPTLMESNPKNAGTMNILIKVFISAGQFLMPIFVGIVGGPNWRVICFVVGGYQIVMAVLASFMRFPDYKAIAREQAALTEAAAADEAQSAGASNALKPRFAVEGVACLVFIFCTNGVVYLANQALPQIGGGIAGLDADQSKYLTSFFTIGSVTAVLLTALLSAKVKSINFVPWYALGGVISVGLLNAGFMHSMAGMCLAAFLIGYFVSGGIMQLVLTAMAEFFPKVKGQITSWYWIAGSVGGFILPYAIGAIVPSTKGMADAQAAEALASGYTNVAWLALGFAVVALLAALFVYRRYRVIFPKSMEELAAA